MNYALNIFFSSTFTKSGTCGCILHNYFLQVWFLDQQQDDVQLDYYSRHIFVIPSKVDLCLLQKFLLVSMEPNPFSTGVPIFFDKSFPSSFFSSKANTMISHYFDNRSGFNILPLRDVHRFIFFIIKYLG